MLDKNADQPGCGLLKPKAYKCKLRELLIGENQRGRLESRMGKFEAERDRLDC